MRNVNIKTLRNQDHAGPSKPPVPLRKHKTFSFWILTHRYTTDILQYTFTTLFNDHLLRLKKNYLQQPLKDMFNWRVSKLDWDKRVRLSWLQILFCINIYQSYMITKLWKKGMTCQFVLQPFSFCNFFFGTDKQSFALPFLCLFTITDFNGFWLFLWFQYAMHKHKNHIITASK